MVFQEITPGSVTVRANHRVRYCRTCKTRLSIYNHNLYCFLHVPDAIVKGKVVREAVYITETSKQSKYRGIQKVYFNKNKGKTFKWKVATTLKSKHVYLGTYRTRKEAYEVLKKYKIDSGYANNGSNN